MIFHPHTRAHAPLPCPLPGPLQEEEAKQNAKSDPDKKFVKFETCMNVFRMMGFNPTSGQLRIVLSSLRHILPLHLVSEECSFAEFVVLWDSYGA